MSLTLGEIVAGLGGALRGSAQLRIHQVAPLDRAGEGEMGFVAHAKYQRHLEACRASAVILPPSLADVWPGAAIVTEDPYLYFARAAQLLNPDVRPIPGVHPSAVVLSDLPDSVSVGPLSFIGTDCVIGENVVIGAGCTVAAGVSIGEQTRLFDRVAVYADSRIGARCILHAGCVVGCDGFGFARRKDGSWEKIPQIGHAILGDDVEVGANTTIDRGALDDTVIGDGVKLDNLIQVAHNCRIGAHTAMAGQSGMAGSSELGERVMVGGQAGIMGHVTVANDVVVSGRSFISKNADEPGVYTSAIPSQPHSEWMRNAVHLRHLDEMARRIKALEKKLEDMEKSQ